jgi:Uncharacterized protein involved in propionate catabolism
MGKLLGREVAVVGVGMHPWGKFPQKSPHQLGCYAVLSALKDAGLEWCDIQYVVTSVTPEVKGNESILPGQVLMEKMGELGIPVDEKLQDSRIQALIQRVKISVQPELESPLTPAKVMMKLRNGQEVTKRVDITTGNPEKPMSLDQMIAKYKNCVGFMMSPKKTDETIDRILHFEEVRDVSKLIALTVKK